MLEFSLEKAEKTLTFLCQITVHKFFLPLFCKYLSNPNAFSLHFRKLSANIFLTLSALVYKYYSAVQSYGRLMIPSFHIHPKNYHLSTLKQNIWYLLLVTFLYQLPSHILRNTQYPSLVVLMPLHLIPTFF